MLKNLFVFMFLSFLLVYSFWGCGSSRLEEGSVTSEAETLRDLKYGDVIELKDISPEILNRLLNSSNPYVKKAVALKIEADKANTNDISLLLAGIATRAEASQKVSEAIKLLEEDLRSFTAFKALLDKNKGDARGSSPLRTSLDKLIGKPGVQTGILQDAAELLGVNAENLSKGQLGQLANASNLITVIKTSLIYLNYALGILPNSIDKIQLAFPAKLPDGVDSTLVKDTVLFKSTGAELLIPNAGFIFGGDFVQGSCRGIDCSSFLSNATNSKVRLSTMVMEFAWRVEKGMSFENDDKDGSLRKEFFEKWGLKEAVEEYEAVDSEAISNLQGGDLVVWRWLAPGSKVKSGHVVMYLFPIEGTDDAFVSVEATRDDNKVFDGILFRKLQFKKENSERYILRRNQ